MRKQSFSTVYEKVIAGDTSFKKQFFMFFTITTIFFLTYSCFQYGYGLLTEEGICTNGIVTIGNESQILNQSAAEYIKNLSRDNRLMGEVFCEAMLNETIPK